MTAETITQNEHGTVHSESSLRQNTLGDITNTIPRKSPSLTKFVTKEEAAHSSLDEAFRLLSQKVNANNQNLLRAIVKYSKRLKMKSDSQIDTALHLFGSSLAKGNQSLHAKSRQLLHKARKGRINVQPEAVKRRKAGGHGRKALPKGKFTELKLNNRMLPDKGSSSMKRQHNFASNIKENVAVSKKAGRNLVSRTKQYLKKRHNTKVKGDIDCKKTCRLIQELFLSIIESTKGVCSYTLYTNLSYVTNWSGVSWQFFCHLGKNYVQNHRSPGGGMV